MVKERAADREVLVGEEGMRRKYNIDASWTVVETDNGDPNRIAVVRCSVVTVRIAVGSSNGEGRNLAVEISP